jgi:hypothetical protein
MDFTLFFKVYTYLFKKANISKIRFSHEDFVQILLLLRYLGVLKS